MAVIMCRNTLPINQYEFIFYKVVTLYILDDERSPEYTQK